MIDRINPLQTSGFRTNGADALGIRAQVEASAPLDLGVARGRGRLSLPSGLGLAGLGFARASSLRLDGAQRRGVTRAAETAVGSDKLVSGPLATADKRLAGLQTRRNNDVLADGAAGAGRLL